MATSALAGSTAPGPNAKLEQRVRDATAVYHELLTTPDRGVPEALLRDCKCISVIPSTLKGAFIYGARRGNGVMSCRTASGWSSPVFLSLTGGSWGLQAGAESSDLVLFFMSENGARSLMTSSRITLGGKASVAAGPIGRTGEASTDLKLNAEVYTYAKTRGLFAGVSLEGARVSPDQKAINRYYGRGVTAKQLLFEDRMPKQPQAALAFRQALP